MGLAYVKIALDGKHIQKKYWNTGKRERMKKKKKNKSSS
jgi:hypothetical protein